MSEVQNTQEVKDVTEVDTVADEKETLNEVATTLFSFAFKNDDDVVSRRQQILTTFSNSGVFKDEYFVLHTLIKQFTRTTISEAFVKMFLASNKEQFVRSSSVNMNNFNFGENDAFMEFTDSCVNKLRECYMMNKAKTEFETAMEMYRMIYVQERSIDLLAESAMIMSDGIKRGYKTLMGYSDMCTYVKSGLAALDNIVDKRDRKGLIVYGEDMTEEESEPLQLIGDFGIDELNEHVQIYEGDMITVMAPPKGCKSRFCTSVVHRMITTGVPCVVWSVENGYKGWESLIRAKHFDFLYNTDAEATARKFINSDMIRKGSLEGQMKEMEEASWLDLRKNKNYGRLASIDEDFNIDNFIDVLDNAVNSVGAKFVMVDYLQLIGAGSKKDTTTERVALAYQKMLQYLKQKKIAGIFPAQVKQTVISSLDGKDDLGGMELRDAGGVSSEVIRTPDILLMLYGSTEDIENGNLQIVGLPSRNCSPFKPIKVMADAGSCTFIPLKEEFMIEE